MSGADAQDALRRAAAVIQRLERRLAAAEQARAEPIAIVGTGCRLPGGVHDLETFWQLLQSEQDVLGTISDARFDIEPYYDPNPDARGKSYVRNAAFLDGVDQFDAEFFGLSPRETTWIDPQHRLFVECTWEALERAGIAGHVRGASVGVYAGIGPSDYGHELSGGPGASLEGYLATGTGTSFVAGRVAYLLGLHGPAVAVDTACSSSLVAVHLACCALRAGECQLAVAGGVQVLLSPAPFVLLSRLRALAPDGRCKTFSDHADGYGRGEGCGVLVLERLSDAQRNGHPILAVIRGSAVNHDGASSGLTTPNGGAQKAVIRSALRNAQLKPADVQYVEAHGTGTALGDPIEVDALAESYGEGRKHALRIGALKATIGHLESAAGVAGVLKVVAALQRGLLPRSLHAEPLSTHVDWAQLPVQVVLQQEAWPAAGQRRIAGVSAFGMSGTNAHVLLEEAPAVAAAPPPAQRSTELFVLSARTPEALAASAARLRQQLERSPELSPLTLAHSLATTRASLTERLAWTASNREELLAALASAEQGNTPLAGARGQAREERGRLAWLLTGQGAQQRGMGRELYDEWPVFRAALDEVFALLQPELERSLPSVMWAPPGTPEAALLDQTGYTQPALFALEWAQAQLWRSFGVEPELLLGHSIGELSAACIAGVFSLPDACRLVAARARLMQALPAGGAMVSIAASEAEVSAAVAPVAASVSVAAINGARSIVIAGRESDVLALAARFAERGVATKRLPVSHAFHSPLMEPMLAPFRAVAQSIRYGAPTIPLISNVSGGLAGPELQTPEYWVAQVRGAVRFADGVGALHAAGARTLMELGPKPTLLGLVPAELASAALLLPTLRAGRAESRTLLEALGGWFVHGGEVAWSAVFPAGSQRVELPSYPWQKQRYWVDAGRGLPAEAAEQGRWALSGVRHELPDGSYHHVLPVGTQLQRFLADHVVHGTVVVPGAFYVSALLAAARARWPEEPIELRDVEFLEALTLQERQSVELHTLLHPGAAGALSAELATRAPGSGEWRIHARAQLAVGRESIAKPPAPSALLAGTRAIDPAALLERLRAVHIDWGSRWYWLTRAWVGDGLALAELQAPDGGSEQVAPLHPVLIDNGFAIFALTAAVPGADETPRLPFAIRRVRWLKTPSGPVRCSSHRSSRAASASREVVTLDLAFWDEAGELVAVFEQFALREAPRRLFLREADVTPEAFYRVDWKPSAVERSGPATGGSWLLLGDGTQLEASVARALEAAGARLIRARSPQDLPALNELSLSGALCLWSAEPSNAGPDALRWTSEALRVVQHLAAHTAPVPMWWVTRGAVSVEGPDAVSPAASALWGLARSVMAEQPQLGCTLIDLDASATAEQLLMELGATDEERQVAWRNGQRYVARLVRARPAPIVPAAENYQLEVRHKGALDSLALAPVARRAPEPGEVELQIHASGLNFRDVLSALGMYPGEAGPLGGECAGVVTALGAGVSRLELGDRVMTCLAPGGFRRFVTVDARVVAKIPRQLSFTDAATLPAAFLTAWYGLIHLAQLQPGERVLIHAAAGGVGMAALQLARSRGAIVLATASPGKWSVLREQGIQHVASSRDQSFAGAFRAAVGGVDVVLNSLAGEFIDSSLELLAPGGRFIEMGKADVRDAATVAAAHPGVRYQAFDLTTVPAELIADMFAEISAGIAGQRLRPLPVRTFRLSEAEAAFRFMAQARHVGKVVILPPFELSRDSTVLVTGGLGALGLGVARRLAERGVAHLVLTGRRGLATPGAEAAVAELRALGATVTVAAVDVSDREALARTLAQLPAELPLRGVVHAAGLLDDGLLSEQTPERFARVLAPKVLGACHLDELTRDLPIEFFVLFSSIAGTLGSAAQGAYAAANAFLDGLAARRHARGQPALSLAWGPWADSGMAATLDAKLQARFTRQGISLLSMKQGLDLFESALGRSESQLVVVPLELRATSRALGSEIPSLWRSLVRAPAASGTVGGGDLRRELAAQPGESWLGTVTDAVRSEVARVLSLSSASQVRADRPLQELGLDSLMAVELRNTLGRRAGASLSATLAFDYPTPLAIAQYLLSDVLGMSPDEAPRVAATPAVTAQHVAADSNDIAIVGMGCRLPGGVTDLDSFWRLLEDGTDAITEIPKERWDVAQWYDADPNAAGKMTTRWGGFLSDIERFDPGFFGISPREAASIDPQERLLLETTWEALEHAGLKADALLGSESGVFMGLCGTEYQTRMMADAAAIDPYALLGTMHSTIVGRLSYWLGLKGPSVPVDTACSSSLVAVHLACQALRAGECSLALAGGANVLLGPEGTVYFSRLGTLSRTGRCRTFSADADGYVRAEGAGVVVLERLADALKNGRHVLAIIRGSAVNQSGRSNGLAAPNGPAQQEVIRKALQRARVAPADVGFVECFGTATMLGDPIEVQALSAVLSEGRSAEQPVILSALKTNVGHMEGAAGVGGLIKAVLALQHGKVPRSLHFSAPNPHIAWSELPVKVAAEAVDWPRTGKARFAGVSSFGISGTNAHVVLQEGPLAASQQAAPARSAELILLTAKTPAALTASAARLREHLERYPELTLGDVAYSLVTTRSQLECRLALVVTSRPALLAALQRIEQGESPSFCAQGRAEQRDEKLVWLFAGPGAQQHGMGRELHAEWPVFRTELERAFAALDPLLERPLKPVLWAAPGTADAGLLEQSPYAEAALLAFGWAQACLWRSWGVEPSCVLGHSTGELTAACVAGLLSIEDAARLLLALTRHASAAAHPHHTPPGGAAADDGLSVARTIAYGAVRPRLLAIAGEWVGAEVATLEHWTQRARQWSSPEAALRAPLSGSLAFLELTPRAILLNLVPQATQGSSVRLLAAQRTGVAEVRAAFAALADWVAWGGVADWAGVFPSGGRHVPLPSYPWQRQRYWVEEAPRLQASSDAQLAARLSQLLAEGKLPAAAAGALPELLRSLANTSTAQVASLPSRAERPALPLVDGLGAGHPPAEREQAVLAAVVEEIARTLRYTESDSFPQHTSLVQLGMDSFMAVELRNRLEKRLRLAPAAIVALDPALTTATSLAHDMLRVLDGRAQPQQRVDLVAEARLPAEVRPLPAARLPERPTSVLLTGATGFLGAFLLAELLEQTEAHVHCLVRAPSPETGLRRLEQNLSSYGLAPALRSRVSVVVGDLAQPRLGLSEAAFQALGAEVDAIFNNGAHVSYVAGYGDLKPTHVDATLEMLRLASAGRPKILHHISSIAAYDSLAYRGQVLTERSVPNLSSGIDLAYSQCKWVSETMVREASARGLPITIHRPSFIGGASDGQWNTSDFLCRIFKGALIDIGCFPGDLELLFDFSPVDFVARSIVHFALRDDAVGRTFHLQHPVGLELKGLVEIFRSLGYPLEPIPYAEWLERLTRDRSSPVYPLTAFLTQRWPADGLTALERSQVGYRPEFDSRETTRELERAGIRCAPLDRQLFWRYFERLAAVGFLPAPRA